ncbi:hypothetical protein DSO57_1015852 [Entomophthora muscae]|uniref:Uncharacterized protein n=1 Tax=Entomophthora muscae TaxID=34485 RepID=A0ACC2UF47_9FUNG|nr:hypothetical protein DSO57_1015852 [Entomophthora muscae]
MANSTGRSHWPLNRDQAQDHKDKDIYEAFVPQQELEFEEIEGLTMLNEEAQKKLEFVIDYLK